MATNRPPRSRFLTGLPRGLAVALGLTLSTGGCGNAEHGGPQGPPPTRVQVTIVHPRDLPRTLSTVGALQSPAMATLAAEVDGRVVALDVPEGQRVEAGHVLARFDDAEARAAVVVARARRDNARDRLRRLENLREKSVSSEQAYDDARAEYDSSLGAFDQARTRLEKTTLAAPFAGVVGLRQVSIGDFLESGDPIVEITQVDPLELRFALAQRYAPELAVGQKLRAWVGRCAEPVEGVVDAIDPRVNTTTRSVGLQARVPNAEGTLYPGMAVGLLLEVGRIPNALVVPQEAIIRQGTRHIVYTLDDEDRAESHQVELGQFLEDGVHLVSGITSGARVVTAGHQKLRPGAPTKPEPFEPVNNPNLALGAAGPEGHCEPRA